MPRWLYWIYWFAEPVPWPVAMYTLVGVTLLFSGAEISGNPVTGFFILMGTILCVTTVVAR